MPQEQTIVDGPGVELDRPAAPRRSDVATTCAVELGVGVDDAVELVDAAMARLVAAVPEAVVVPPAAGTLSREAILPGGGTVEISVAVPVEHGSSATGNLLLTVRLTGTVSPVGDRAMAAVRRAPLTERELRQLRFRMPLTVSMGVVLPGGALAAAALLVVAHDTPDLLMMIEAAIGLGADPRLLTVLDAAAGHSARDMERVHVHLNQMGVTIWPLWQMRDALAAHARRAFEHASIPLIVDDGGYALPVLLSALPQLVPIYGGVVERSTARLDELTPCDGTRLPPVFSIAESRLKTVVESRGAAEAMIRRAEALVPWEAWESQAVLVVGFGTMGRHLAEALHSRRARVAVYDSDPIDLVAAHECGFVTARGLSELLASHQPALVIGATGTLALRGDHLAQLQGETVLLSTSRWQREFALDDFAETAATHEYVAGLGMRYLLGTGASVTVLTGDQPSQRARYSDLVTAAALLGAVTLVTPHNGFSFGRNVKRSDDTLAASGLAESYYRMYGPGDQGAA